MLSKSSSQLSVKIQIKMVHNVWSGLVVITGDTVVIAPKMHTHFGVSKDRHQTAR